MENGFTRPIVTHPQPLPSEIFDAQIKLAAKRKLARIIRSKPTTEIHISPGDMVCLFLKQDKEKRGKWF